MSTGRRSAKLCGREVKAGIWFIPHVDTDKRVNCAILVNTRANSTHALEMSMTVTILAYLV